VLANETESRPASSFVLVGYASRSPIGSRTERDAGTGSTDTGSMVKTRPTWVCSL